MKDCKIILISWVQIVDRGLHLLIHIAECEDSNCVWENFLYLLSSLWKVVEVMNRCVILLNITLHYISSLSPGQLSHSVGCKNSQILATQTIDSRTMGGKLTTKYWLQSEADIHWEAAFFQREYSPFNHTKTAFRRIFDHTKNIHIDRH